MKNLKKTLLILILGSIIGIASFVSSGVVQSNNDVVICNANTSFVHTSSDPYGNVPIALTWKSTDLSHENDITVGSYRNFEPMKTQKIDFSNYDYATIRTNQLITITDADLSFPDGDYTSIMHIRPYNNGGDNGFQSSFTNIYKNAGCDLTIGKNGNKGAGTIYQNYWYGSYTNYNGYQALYFRAIPALMHDYSIHETKINDWDEVYAVKNTIDRETAYSSNVKNLNVEVKTCGLSWSLGSASVWMTYYYWDDNKKLQKKTILLQADVKTTDNKYSFPNDIAAFSNIEFSYEVTRPKDAAPGVQNFPFNSSFKNFYLNNNYLDQCKDVTSKPNNNWTQYNGNLNSQILYSTDYVKNDHYKLNIIALPEMIDHTILISTWADNVAYLDMN